MKALTAQALRQEGERTVENLRKIVQACRLPILALSYNQTYEYAPFTTDEETRIELLLRFVEAGGAAIDLQGYTYDLPSKDAFRKEFSHLGYSFIRDLPKEVVVDEKVIQRQMELIDRVHHASCGRRSVDFHASVGPDELRAGG